MNRNEEYEQLLTELDIATPPALEYTLNRAKARQRRKQWIVRPLISLSAAFACFVVLVNFSVPVALACAKIPLLRELATAVNFSNSLMAAVDHEYAQVMNLEQAQGEVTARVEYLIVDQKQLNIFYRLNSKVYKDLTADARVSAWDGEELSGYSSHQSHPDASSGKLQCITVDFIESDMPSGLQVHLKVLDRNNMQEKQTDVPAPAQDYLFDDVKEKTNYVANFDFKLEFDPAFTASTKRKYMEVNQTVTLGDQKIRIKDIEIYPTHLRLNVADVAGNTAWLKDLKFYIKTDENKKLDTIANGIAATGESDSPMMVTYRADSPYFYDAKQLKIYITGAVFLSKDMEKIHVNLATGEADRMPEGTEIDEIKHEASGWVISVRAKVAKKDAYHQIFASPAFDESGNEWEIDRWSTDTGETEGYFTVRFPLKGYPFDEVWLSPSYSYIWWAENPVEITAQ